MFQDNIWSCIQTNGMPTPKSGHCCTVVQKCFYVFGGQTNTEVLNEFHRFNLEDQTWSKIKADQQPTGRSSAGMCSSETLSKIYIFGGTQFVVEKTCKNDLYEYDISSNKWTIIASSTPAPCDRYGHSMLFNNYQIYIFGGVHYIKATNRMNPEFLNDLWVFSLIDKMWKKLELRAQAQPQPRYRHSTAIIGNELYIIGGTTNQNRFGQIIKTDFENMQWQFLELEALKNKTKKNLFKGRFGHACFVIENMVYIYSGMDDGLCDDALQLDVQSNKWGRKKFFGQIPPREFFSYAQTDTQLYIFGGKNSQNQRLNDLHLWNHNLKQDEQKYCTLRQEIYGLLELSENCANYIITTKNNTYMLHRALLYVRCPILIQQADLQFSDPLIQLLITYIYKADFQMDILRKVEIREALQFCLFVQDEIFAGLIVQYFLIDCKGQSDYEFIEKELFQLTKQNQGQVIFLFQNVLQILNLRKQKQLVQLFAQQRIYFKNLEKQMIDKFYDDLRKLQYHSQTDTILEINGKEINIHSFILVARSEYFRAMVHFEEGHAQHIKLDFDPSLVQNIVNYLYNGYKALQKGNTNSFDQLIDVFKASNYFMLNNQTFMFLIQEGMAQYINQETVFDIAEVAEQLSANYLMYECCTYISEHLKGVPLSELRKLSKEVLIRILEVIGQKQ